MGHKDDDKSAYLSGSVITKKSKSMAREVDFDRASGAVSGRKSVVDFQPPSVEKAAPVNPENSAYESAYTKHGDVKGSEKTLSHDKFIAPPTTATKRVPVGKRSKR